MNAAPLSASPTTTVADALVRTLASLGAREAFGVSGGAMAVLWDALSAGPLAVHHFRHENGAGFAAAEASLATGRPVILFTTTGPGLTNALTSIFAAREEGARLIVLSAHTSAASRGRFAIQETSRDTLPPSLYAPGRPFHFATVLDDPAALPAIGRALADGLGRPGGFVAHVALDPAAQRAPFPAAETARETPDRRLPVSRRPCAPTADDVAAVIAALEDGPFTIWVGYGARGAAAEVAELARRMRAPVMCTGKAKGIFPEDDALFAGVTGLAGHSSVWAHLEQDAPRRILVLGSRLGETSSFWDRRFVAPAGFVHVDVDPGVPGAAYPDVPVLPVVADVGATLRAVLAGLPAPRDGAALPAPARPRVEKVVPRAEGPARPEALMDALQEHVVEGSDATVLAESGHSFLWAIHRLRFAAPFRFRASTSWGSMGHAAAGVVGVALATGRKAVAVVGDGALLMTNEISTAVRAGAPATWVVLNDARYGMCAQGMDALGLSADATIPPVDFVAFARAQGARAVRVEHETELGAALVAAMAAAGPFLVDVRIDPRSLAPASLRNSALAGRLAAGSERTFPVAPNS